ncbi:MAG: methyltransferase domain-containing protein [Candidatus Lokiarchaeota archaeon]|nr:methyltransferase domain-containing protein [Candidatus Lokiarchaeota archaeon]
MSNKKLSKEPENKKEFTRILDEAYSKYAHLYDIAVKAFPLWKQWIKKVIPYIQGPRILELSFGTGYLLTKYADQFETYGIDYNKKMVEIARKNLEKNNISAKLRRADVESLPYPDNYFDSIVNTMAFTGYPRAYKAMSEIRRVLKSDGRLIMVDVNYPKNQNWLGTLMAKFWESEGDIIRNMDKMFKNSGFLHIDKEVGGFGSVHLYYAKIKN